MYRFSPLFEVDFEIPKTSGILNLSSQNDVAVQILVIVYPRVVKNYVKFLFCDYVSNII